MQPHYLRVKHGVATSTDVQIKFLFVSTHLQSLWLHFTLDQVRQASKMSISATSNESLSTIFLSVDFPISVKCCEANTALAVLSINSKHFLPVLFHPFHLTATHLHVRLQIFGLSLERPYLMTGLKLMYFWLMKSSYSLRNPWI